MKEIKICYYLADDGTKFDTENECLDYEFKRKMKDMVGKDLRLFDSNHKEVTNYTFGSICDAYAIQVLTIKGAKFIVEWSDEYGTEAPFGFLDIETQDEDLLGTWAYDAFDRCGWTHLDKFKRKVDELYFALQ